MRKLRVLLLSIIVLLFLFAPMFVLTEEANARPPMVQYYKVYHDGTCIVGPVIPHGTLMGEWTRNCDGTWTGWGSRPNSACTYSEIDYDFC